MQIIFVLGFLINCFFGHVCHFTIVNSWLLLGKLQLCKLKNNAPLLYFELTYFLHCNRYLFCTSNFSSLIDLYFLDLIDHCEEKLALWYIVKCDPIEWLFIDYFCLIIWYSTRSCLSCCYFCNDIKILFYPQLL